MIKAVLLDLAGVVYDGEKAVPGATAAVDRLREAGLPVRFVSNTTRATKAAILERLARLGIAVGGDELFTPAEAACNWLRQHGRSPHLLVHPDLVAEFQDIPPAAGRAIVVGDAGDAFDYRALNAAFRELIDGAEFLALAPNRTFKDADGKLSLDAGAFVTALEFASQKKAIVVGKPAGDFFRSALATVPCSAVDAVMVGDDAETDVAGALSATIGDALLVRTGKYRQGDEARFEPAPTATLNDISAAVEWILAKRISCMSP